MSKEVSKLKEALNSLSQLSYSTNAPKRQSQQLEALQQQVKQLQNQLAVSVIICKLTHYSQFSEDIHAILQSALFKMQLVQGKEFLSRNSIVSLFLLILQVTSFSLETV